MNKIYKVIWSKTRNCYVAVSEIAKRNGKGSGAVGGAVVGNGAVNGGASVNCGATSVCGGIRAHNSCGLSGAKAKGSSIALTLALALCVTGGAVLTMPRAVSADGGTITVNDAGDPQNYTAGKTEGGELTIKPGDGSDYYLYYPSDPTITTLKITGGDVLKERKFAGYYSGSEVVSGYTVSVSGGTLFRINGGYSSTKASNNHVEITGGKIKAYAYGGFATNEVTGNTVTISGNAVFAKDGRFDPKIFGGYSDNSNGSVATENKVTFTGGTFTTAYSGSSDPNGIFGGYVMNKGNATNNIVVIGQAEGATTNVTGVVIGGGAGINGGTATGNTVTISGGTVSTTKFIPAVTEYVSGVFGGYSREGEASNNTVTISGGTVSADATADQKGIFGGYSRQGEANSNIVTINGGTLTGDIYGGCTGDGNRSASNNTVNLLGTASINGGVYGSNKSGTGNELHIGGTKTAAEGITDAPWTGTTDNKVNSVNNFSSIVLHKVNWSTTTPVLAAGSFTNTANLDISGMTFTTTPTAGTMKLLQSDNADFGSMKLAYDAATQTTPVGLTTSGVVVGSYKVTDGSDDKFYKNRKTVALANENKDVTYTISHLSYTDTANKAVTLFVQPSASDTEAGYTVVNEDKRLYLADGFNSLTVADGNWNTMTRLNAGYSETGDVTGKTFSVTGGTISNTTPDNESEIYGGYSKSGAVTNNTVTISKTDTTVTNINGMVYGGYSSSGIAKKNIVEISGGTITKTVYGGYSQSGTAGGEVTDTDPYKNGNKVSISGGTVNYWVYGGCSGSGAARYNTIEITGGTITNMVYGGRGATDTTGNKVTIKGGTISSSQIYGGFTDLRDGITSVAAKGNAVTIEGGDFKNTHTAIYGGFTDGHNASGNAVTISTINNGALGAVYGGYVDNNSGTAGDSAAGNVVTINGGVVELVYGGYIQNGVAGGVSTSDDPYENGNKVTITDGEVTTVYGGFSGEGTAINNQVTISGGTVNGEVYGGRGATDTTGNKVTIEGGKISSNLIYGGLSKSGKVNNNTVEISGGTFDNSYLTIYGGRSESGSANNNTVEISGGTFDNSYLTIYGGKGVEANNNTVEISVANFKAASICVGDGATSTGNTLVLGAKGVKIHDSESGIGVIGGVQTIALTDKVQFEDKTAVLKADKFAKDNKTAVNAANFDGTLDISAATGLQGATAPGVMTLLQSDTENNFTTLDLKYKDATGSEQTVNLSGETTSQIVREGAAQENEKNGVKLVYRNTHTVSVAAGGKTITYNIANPVGDITFGSIDWVKGGTTRTLTAAEKALLTVNGTTAVNAADLTFTGTINENPLNQSMTLLAGATGITGDHITPPGEGKGEVAVAYTDAKGVELNARAKGEVSVASGAVKYTINSVALDKATLGSLAWGDTDSLPESWQASATTQIDDTNFAYTGTAGTALKAGNTATILTAPGLTTGSKVTDGTVAGKTVGINYTDDAGVTYTATASGHVAAAKDAVNYVVDSVAATGVNLQSWNGTDTSTAVTTNGWNGTGVAVATGSFAAPTDLNLGETRTIATAPTGFFGTVTGSNAFPSNGGTLSEDTGGVKLAGSMIGGVKAEDEGAKLTYYAMKKTADTMTLGTFAFADGDTNARTYGKEYDLTNAEITTDGLAFTEDSKKAMETGNKMTLVDASGAYKNGGAALKTLSSRAKTSFAVAFTDTIEGKGITFVGTHTDTLALADDSATNTKQSKLIYTVGDKNVSTATLSGGIAWSDGVTHYTNKNYKFDGNTKVNVGVNFTATADPLNQSMTLIGADSAGHAVKGTVSGTPGFTVKMNNTSLDATVTGAASIDSGNLKYTVTGVTLNKVTVDSVGSDAVPEGWSTAADVQVDTESMNVPTDAAYGQPQNIMTSDSAIFSDDNISGKNKYGASPENFEDKDNTGTPAVTIEGTQDAGVKASADKKSLVYEVGKKEATSVKLGTVTWAAGSQLMDGSNGEYDYSSVQSVDTGSFAVKYDAPQNIDISKNESMTLLQANDTLKAIVDEEKKQAYSYTPVTGVTMDANIIGRLTNNSGAVTYTPTANKAVSLIFGDVDWLDSGALIDHKTTLSNVSFDGAAVDTTKINFTNKEFMEADKQMTLVSDFGGKPGSITGSKYMVGTGFEGEGSASMEDGNLIFKTRTGAGVSEQTHKTVMAMEADVALLNAGSEHIDNVMTGLGDPANMGEDGTSTAVSIGGGGSRHETGSHVSSHTWNAAVGVGRRRELDKGTLEYGIFGEYGKSSYTLHSDAGKGDGDSHHAGGGLLAKWTNKHDVYTEASFRLGRMSNSASNVLRDAAGNGFGYDVHATYYGAHVGVGKIFRYNGGRSLDVYGKFFYTKRNGVNFTAAAQQYDLDSVASSILRIGARYGTTDRKWNWYGGLAYEYEFDGEASGTVNGAAVRAASIKGGSGRAEIGMRMNATKTNPWQADISLYGYAGKHRGFGGNISVAYMF